MRNTQSKGKPSRTVVKTMGNVTSVVVSLIALLSRVNPLFLVVKQIV